jgi:FkbM family methyltransferase
MSGYRADNFTLRHRFIAMLSRHMQNNVYTCRNGLAKGLKRKGGLGFIPSKSAETEEVEFFRGLDLSGKVVYDVGGFHGLMTIFFAKTARQVITYEANPENVMRIYENARINNFDNVMVRNVAVSTGDGVLTLSFDPLMSGAATGDPEITKSLNDTGAHVQHFSVAMTSLDDDVSRLGLPAPDFVKIDIEGMELNALQGMREILSTKRPDLYIEMHGTTREDKQANAHAVIGLLVECGYDILNVEAKQAITFEKPTGRESHIYCRSRTAPRYSVATAATGTF